ncbi:MAG: alpha/beta hydrolase, partial [Gammaproteobacteria bacterium]|nr:alpha/beta hydrolase [Gammaproteobacteria bacterium]
MATKLRGLNALTTEHATPKTQSIAANGMNFTADLAGPADGELVLCLHGYPQTKHTWRRELPALAERGYRVCAPDQRGYSYGARPSGIDSYRVETLAGDALAIADALGCERFHLVGHDWGGQLAWVVAAFHPHRVRTLAVISRPHPQAFAQAMKEDRRQSGRSSHHRSFQRAEATDELLADDAAKLRAIFKGNGVPDADARAYLATLGHREALDAALNWYRALGRSDIQWRDVPAVTVPTLYVWGNADQAVGRMAAEGTQRWV